MSKLLFVVMFALSACATRPPAKAAREPLAPWVKAQAEISWRHLQANISPAEPKSPGGPKPLPGIVVAALSKKDPDYYFHWVRDSSNVMSAVARVLSRPPYLDMVKLDARMGDFLRLSRGLQKAPYGLGEPRFTVDGKADTLPWSRPQYDGPALRALAVMRYLSIYEKSGKTSPLKTLALEVLRTDLDFIAQVWKDRGFDIWEEYKADNYNTRLTQLVALEKGKHWIGPRYQAIARELEKLLDDHWDPARGFLRSQLAIAATDGYTAKKTDLDSAVIVTVMDADRERLGHSVLDDRVQGTVAVHEDLFRNAYPINKTGEGLVYGRYAGDVYFGGNPWYLISAYYAQFYFRLSRRLHDQPFAITKNNFAFAKGLLPKSTALEAGQTISVDNPLHKELIAASRKRGEAILQRLQMYTPADGQLYEQIDKTTGQPVSSRGIGWAHAAFLEAALESEILDGTL